jgi:ligand-binding SRPBCC domain-containing protein
MPENIFLDGLGSFNHNTKNAGAIKWGEFNNAAVNTGSIVLSAVFTGSSVNSGTIGDLMPVYTVSVFQANSGNWESTYSTVAANSSTWGQGGGGGSSDWSSITNKPTEFNPSTHSHTVSEITGLEPVVTWVSQNSAASEGADAYALIVSNSATWSTIPDTSLGNAAYTLIANNSATWEAGSNISLDWSSITNKPTEFAPSSHFHHASSINAGVLDPARIPVINTSIQVISQGGLADLTQEQQDSVVQGAIVTTTDGQRYVYVGGTKTIVGSYIALADITPDWNVISNKPSLFTPSSHTHTVSEVEGLQPVVTWVSQNSANNVDVTLGNSAYTLIANNSATWATVPDTSLGNSAYTLIASNSTTWAAGGDWSNITSKPTEFTPSSHFHHASSINAGVLDPARIPVINTSIQVISPGGIANLTLAQQNEITKGALVTTTDGQRYVYTGGSKTSEASYILLADVTPDWSVIANKPTAFAPSSHTHVVSEVTGLQPVVTWVAQNSAATPSIINYLFDNGNSKVSLNSRGTITLPTNFSITEWKIVADIPTTTVITLNKSSFDNFPTMTSLGTVSVTNNRKNLNVTPGFANLSADDILEFIVSANSDATKLTISLKGYKI